MFYCSGRAYVGLGKPLTKQLKSCFLNRFAEKMPLKEFIEEVTTYADELCANSISSFEEFPGDLELHGLDTRLQKLRNHCESQVFERFFENYKQATTLKSSKRDCDLERMQCECREFERTGVACPHLILAMIASDKQYTEAVDACWKKKRLLQ